MAEPVLAGPEVIDQTSLQATGIIMIVLASTVFIARVYLSILKHRRPIAWEDGWLIAAYIFFMATSILYLYIAPFIFKLQHLGEGRIAPYPTFLDDVLLCRSVFFFTSIGLSLCLWSVKASLLSLYKRLLQGGGLIFLVSWWVIVVFCFLAFIATITAGIMACETPAAWFEATGCDASSPRNARATFVSLFLGTACDITTDLLIMLLPLALIRNLQMHWRRKLTVAGLFVLGWVCIAAAIIRAAYLGSDITHRVTNGSRFKVPSPPWLALWAMVEAAIAIIIGSSPGLYRELQLFSSSRKGSREHSSRHVYNVNRYIKQSQISQPQYHQDPDEVAIDLGKYPRNGIRAQSGSSSQQELIDTISDTRLGEHAR